jgi:hypothetical protein
MMPKALAHLVLRMVPGGAGQAENHARQGTGRRAQPASRHLDGSLQQIRGVMKTFGLVVPKGKGGAFEKNVRALLAGETAIAAVILPLLEAWRAVRAGPLSSTAGSLPRCAKVSSVGCS